MLGVCYEMIQQDVVDYDFLNAYCVGFDADHMPKTRQRRNIFGDI